MKGMMMVVLDAASVANHPSMKESVLEELKAIAASGSGWRTFLLDAESANLPENATEDWRDWINPNKEAWPIMAAVEFGRGRKYVRSGYHELSKPSAVRQFFDDVK